MGLNVSPPIWQTYINTILNSLQSRKYCEAIMDDLLLFTPSKKVHLANLEDLLKALINIASFVHLLRKVDFDAVVDHLAIMHIMRSKVEPTTPRIKRLLEALSSYSFNLYYIKERI